MLSGKGSIAILNTGTGLAANNVGKIEYSKKCLPFTDSINEINNTQRMNPRQCKSITIIEVRFWKNN